MSCNISTIEHNHHTDIYSQTYIFIRNADVNSLFPSPKPVENIDLSTQLDLRLLHEPFVEHAIYGQKESRDSAAVIGWDAKLEEKVQYTYAELESMCARVGQQLAQVVQQSGGSKDKSRPVVTVVMEKGWEQVVAVLSIHRAQCAYLPVDARLWPEHRVRQVLELSESSAVITQSELLQGSHSWLKTLDLPILQINASVFAKDKDGADDAKATAIIFKGPKKGLVMGVLSRFSLFNKTTTVDADILKKLPRADPMDLAYLIYTSGSTGVPKGVCCHHQGAMNTIDHLTERFSIGAGDCVLGISSLAFDLSVYDIFGLLAVGGRVVLPPAGSASPPDPGVWLELVKREGVTLWNSVPAIVDLLVSHAEYSGEQLPASLRLVFMSGDWIPPSLPGRIRAVCANKDVRVIAMGGATEAAIWSNMYELGCEGSGLPAGWTSVPYGQPMRNQSMYILDESMEHCESWVTGGIYIGGAGVASGYYRNPERTAYQFVRHPATGEALFRTGDLGRVRPDGLLEILGREDSQVKVNGFRIELGEIERVIQQHADVQSAAVAVHRNMLCAYVVLSPDSSKTAPTEHPLLFEDIRKMCTRTIAEYMVPHHYMVIEKVPLSGNGKVQREKLPAPDSGPSDKSIVLGSGDTKLAPRCDFEVSLMLSLKAFFSLLLVYCVIWSGALDSSGILLPYSTISQKQHIIITLTSTLF